MSEERFLAEFSKMENLIHRNLTQQNKLPPKPVSISTTASATSTSYSHENLKEPPKTIESNVSSSKILSEEQLLSEFNKMEEVMTSQQQQPLSISKSEGFVNIIPSSETNNQKQGEDLKPSLTSKLYTQKRKRPIEFISAKPTFNLQNLIQSTSIGEVKRPQQAFVSDSSDKNKKVVQRKIGNQFWEDTSLSDWPQNDYRVWVGDLGNDVNDEDLMKAFSQYSSLTKARVVRDPKSGYTKGYGFLSFLDGKEYLRALKEMDGKFVGSRPMRLKASTWKERSVEEQKKKKQRKYY